MKNENKIKTENCSVYLTCSLVFLSLFILLIILLKTIDVGFIDSTNLTIGFSSLNKSIFESLGQNNFWYVFTNILGYFSILIAFCFFIFGLCQLIKRRSLKNIDKDIFAIGIIFVALALLYIIFEFVIINFRPIEIDGKFEASFPSSHTMLNLTIFGVAIIYLNKNLKTSWLKFFLIGILSFLMILATIGRLLSGVHWFTDIIGAILISACLIFLFKFLIFKLNKKTNNQN